MAIPKILHFVWIGPEMPDIYQRSLDRWKELHPDYEIMFWDGIPKQMAGDLKTLIHTLPFYCQKSDIIRYWAIYNYGGMYFDLDEYPYRSVDELRKYKAFTAVQYNRLVACACLGSEKHSEQYKMVMDTVRRRAKRGLKRRCDYGPSMLSTRHIREVFRKPGAIIGPDSWFYIEPPKKKKQCVEFAFADLEGKDKWIEDRKSKFRDGVTPYAVHLWGWKGSSFRKVGQK